MNVARLLPAPRARQFVGEVVRHAEQVTFGIAQIWRKRAGAQAHEKVLIDVVILTGKPDSAAVVAAKKLDVNGFAVAPLSLEKLAKTIGAAMARTWTLQEPGVYAAVPGVLPSLVEPEKPKGAGGPSRVFRKNEQVTEAPAQARASHGATRLREARLKNIHMCPLADLKAGAILARDLHDKAGHLLLRSGTELKSSLINRLNSIPHGQSEVWVGEWDQAPPQ